MGLQIWLTGFYIVGCIVLEVSYAKKSELEKKVDALDQLIRAEIYLLHEKIDRDRHERGEFLRRLNETLKYLTRGDNETISKTQDQAYKEDRANGFDSLHIKVEQNNEEVKEILDILTRTRRGIMKEKEARKSNENELIIQLIKLEEKQNEIINRAHALQDNVKTNQNEIRTRQNDLAHKINITVEMVYDIQVNVRTIQNKISTDQDDLADKIIAVSNKTDILQVTTNALKEKSEALKKKLDIQKSDITSLVNSNQLFQGQQLKIQEALETLLQLPDTVTKTNDFIQATVSLVTFHVALVGGTNQYEGRVELLYEGRRGIVCDDFWDDTDAQVVCRMLGYNGGVAFLGAYFGRGKGEILLDDVSCEGDEKSLFSCTHAGIGNNNCDHGEDAGVRCG